MGLPCTSSCFVLASLFGSSCFVDVKFLASYPGSFDSPCGVLAFSESSKKMFFLFLQQLGGGAHSGCSMEIGVPATLYLDGIVWGLSHLRYKSVYVCFLNTDVFKAAIIFWCYKYIQEGHGSIFPGLFTGELYLWIDGIQMFQDVPNVPYKIAGTSNTVTPFGVGND